MFKFKLSAEAFNLLQRRFIGVAASDKDATVNFTLDGSTLTVCYKSKLGRSEALSLFVETFEVEGAENSGSATILIKELSGIKIEPFSKEDKFPFVESIQFLFQNSVLKTEWEVFYARDAVSKVNLAHAILENTPDLKEFELLRPPLEEYLELVGEDMVEIISYCNIFKSDATSKLSNGCLFQAIEDSLVAVGTDSIVASKFAAPVRVNTLKSKFKLVLDNSILVFIKTFIKDLEIVRLHPTKRVLLLESGNRRMSVPLMNVAYNIKDPIGFFEINSPYIGEVQPSPIVAILNTLTHLSTDVHGKIELEFSGGQFNISNQKNSTKGLPCKLVSDASIKVNSGLFLTSVKKIESFSKNDIQLYFNTENRRIILSSQNRELIFLIQGMKD